MPLNGNWLEHTLPNHRLIARARATHTLSPQCTCTRSAKRCVLSINTRSESLPSARAHYCRLAHPTPSTSVGERKLAQNEISRRAQCFVATVYLRHQSANNDDQTQSISFTKFDFTTHRPRTNSATLANVV
jgi:hypothetical protein